MEKIWDVKKFVQPEAPLLSAGGLHPLVLSILTERGYATEDQICRFLAPALAGMIDPLLLSGMDRAVERLLAARRLGEHICVYGDYDVDGITGTALLVSFLQTAGFTCGYFIPNRFDEGYGINAAAVEAIAASGAKLIVSVDCGTTAVEEAELCRQLGMDLIIVDHHMPREVLPDASAVLNPLQPGCQYPFKSLAGVGVAFNLLVALRSALRTASICEDAPLPDLREWLDLVALGTIADVVPLTDQNRIYVTQGLKRLADSSRPGIRALKEVAGIGAGPVSCGQVGFRLAPRLNAAGRMESAVPGVDLLMSTSLEESKIIASELDAANAERQSVERRIFEEAVAMVEFAGGAADRCSIVLASAGWHQGVVGIVASRLVERYHRPTILVALSEDGQGKGSGRSIPGFHLLDALTVCAEHLERFGGHRYAAGITIAGHNIDRFGTAFEEVAASRLNAEDLRPRLAIDAEVSPDAVTPDLAAALKRLEPFGMGNPEPVLLMRRMTVSGRKVVGAGHQKLLLTRDGYRFDAIAFNQADREACDVIDIAFFPEMNEWNGSCRLQLRVKDQRPSE